MHVLYNLEIKNIYLDQFPNPDTKEVYTRLFKKSFEIESMKEKDLYDFEDDELEYFLGKILKPKTKESARTYCNVLSNYIQWGIDKRYSKQILNPIKRRQEYFYEFVQESKMYISYAEKQAIIRPLMNKQDSFIIEALWHGIQGTKVSELVNLRIADIDPTNRMIAIRNDAGDIVRFIKLEDDNDTTLIEMAFLANKEEVYYRLNGTVDYSPNLKESVQLSESRYVLKSAHTRREGGKDGGEKISHYTVYNRLEMIRTLEDNEDYTDALTTKNIVRSGMIYMALKLYQRDGEIGRSQIEEICVQYNLKYKWSLRDFLNLEILSELYPKEMKKIAMES
ncbi:hypothetical protein BSK59_15745 [Paenibacillus odorifer]|uniref:phage lytic cycle repressor MrpR family protein n=1 Tax=Paenibacillus odorifer TaxID=189426 RepID=UPI00096D1186|nr:hypothetical protein [Paenibacillus odorifer]OME54033.1 hypothetical protein BSK59_15745 [Paenibacillus odorifer]